MQDRDEAAEDRDRASPPVETPHAQDAQAVTQALGVVPEEGLEVGEAKQRLARYGPNALREPSRTSALRLLADQFRGGVVFLLIAAGALAFAFGEILEGWAIVAVLLLNAAIGWTTELRAVRSMEALRKMTQITAKVRREGRLAQRPARQLVPGDVVVVEGGDLVPADVRLLEANQLEADESALTGESVPVAKSTEAVDASTVVADRTCMLHQGTVITRGSALGVVVATGTHTELGRIAELADTAEDTETKLELRLDELGRELVWVVLGIAAAVTAIGFLRGKELFLMIETGIALAVAAIPEGLPVVATLALARGMLEMARRNAIVNRLAAVETLGSTNLLAVDKTGTLTENKMTVRRLVLPHATIDVDPTSGDPFQADGTEVALAQDPVLAQALEVGALCNNAALGDDGGEPVGDPLEIALLEAARVGGRRRQTLLEDHPEQREEAFSTDTKMMATFHAADQGLLVAVKGAPEQVLDASTHVAAADGPEPLDEAARQRWLDRNQALAREGLRVLALARRPADTVEEAPYQGLVFLGLVGLVDPPREDIAASVAECQHAGIRVIMVTGDQPETARYVADAVGIGSRGGRVVHGAELGDVQQLTPEQREEMLEADIFARVTPEQKLSIIQLHQQAGNVVAMTGDGVNDAPALRRADIGVAMGQRGTQVAREASDVVLKDDAFTTIVSAVRQGRVIFGNIRRFILYLLSCNVSEVLVVGLAAAVDAPLALLPLQILFLNLVTDVFPALALGLGKGSDRVMDRPPRAPGEPFLRRDHWMAIGGYGGIMALSVLGAFAIALGPMAMDPTGAVTVSFLTLALAQLWHVFNMRDPAAHLLDNEITRNGYVWGALALCIGLLGLAVYLPPMAEILSVRPIGGTAWTVVLAMSLVPLLLGQIVTLFRGRAEPARQEAAAPVGGAP